MNPRRSPAALLVATLAAAAAASSSSLGCGSGGNTGFAGAGGGHDPDGGDAGITLSGGGAGDGGGLDASIEQGQVPVKLVTLSCPGDCATLAAVGTGGNPPYTFSWDDGSTASTRIVCPKATTSYSVEVTDTAAGGELGRPAQTAQARVTADVLSCPDGGASDGGAAGGGVRDGGVDGSGPLCVGNPSFEGMAKSPGIDAPPWASCTMTGFDTATIDPAMPGALQTFPPPSDGSTYLALSSTYTFGTAGAGIVTAPLCAPMHAGTSYSLQVDLANASGAGLTPTSLEIIGGTQFCDMEEGLWTSPVPGATWTTFCATLTPHGDWSYLTLAPSAEATAELFIDHIVPVASCP